MSELALLSVAGVHGDDTAGGVILVVVGAVYLLLGRRAVDFSNRMQDWFRSKGAIGFGARSARAHRLGAWFLVALGLFIAVRSCAQ